MAAEDRPLVVSVVVADGLVGSFGLGVCAEVFGYDRRAMGLPQFDFALVSEAPGVLRTDTGIPITVEHGLDRLARSDIISITAWELFDRVPSPALLDAFRAAHARGATIVSHCTGAFVLASAGLLDGLRVTTHWKYAGELAARFPAVAGRPLGALRRQRPGHHRRGHGGRRRHPPAPGAPRVGRRRGQRAGPRDGRAPAPRRRPGAVHRRARARLPGRPARRRPGLGAAPPRRGHHRGDPGATGPDEPAELRPPVQGHHGDDAARLAARSAARRRRGAARGERRPGRGDRPARRLRHRGRPARAVRPPPRRLAAGLPADLPRRAGQPAGRRRCSSTGTGLAGWGAIRPWSRRSSVSRRSSA